LVSRGRQASRLDPHRSDPSGRQTVVRRYTDHFGPGRNDERAERMAFKLILDTLNGEIEDEHTVDDSVDG